MGSTRHRSERTRPSRGGLDDERPTELSYANVVATLALFLTLTGGAVWAARNISGKQIKKNSIPGNRIKKKTLTNDRIKKKTLTNDRIKPGTIQRTALARARCRA